MAKSTFLGATALRSAALFGLAVTSFSPALAQDAPADSTQAEAPTTAQAEEDDSTVVVTGSRLRRSPFNTPDPVTIIDPATAQAAGQFSTAEMLQSSPVAAGSAQVTSAISSAFVTNGGPGAETISLRGLGAERTLVLLNGRRAGPAGTRGAISAFDLNVLPQSIVSQVEILKTGASSVYGSDAVAGVVNLITKKNTNGIELDAFASVPGESGGEQYRLSASWGKDFGNGHILAAFDYFKRANFQRADRDYLTCPEEYIFRRDGSRADIIDPRTGAPRCNELAWGHVWVYTAGFAQAGRWQYNYAGDNLGAHIPLRNPANPRANFITPPGFYQVGYDRASTAVDNYYHPMYGRESLIPETELYTGYIDAAYNVSDSIEVGVELLHNRRETKSTSFRQFWYLTGYTQNFTPGFGDPFSVGWGGPFYLSPTVITDHNSASQKVEYSRGLAWIDGKLGSDFNWNGYVQYSRSDGDYTSDVIFKDSVDLHDYRTGSCAGTRTPVSNRPCIDIDWTRPGFLAGEFTAAERDMLFGTDTGNTVYTQLASELSLNGRVLTLPWSGDVQAALGVAYRRDEIDDTPGAVTLAGNAWGQTSAGRTAGWVVTKEAFGEIEIPLLKDIPLIKSLTISGSGRVTNVKATRASDRFEDESNGNWTYSVGVNWQLTDFLRLRGRYGTSFRAPALFEQFLANQSSFLTQRQVDPCIQWATNPATNARVKANCQAAGIPGDHSGAGPSVTVIQGGGIGVLDPETSTAKSISAVLTPRFAFLPNTRINIAVDYFDIDIRGEIATLSAANIVGGCYNSEFFPTDPLCSLFTRLPAGVSGVNNVDRVQATFININQQRNRGVDVTASVEQGLGSLGRFVANAQMTWQIEDTVALFNNTANDNTGEAGEPRWVGDFDFFWHPNDTLSFYYGLNIIGATSDEGDYRAIVGDICRTTAVYGEFCVDLKAEARFYHSVSVTKKLKNFDFTLGVSNLFDQKPPRVTVAGGNSLNQGTINTVGQSVFASQYDYLGRRFFVGAKARF
ncbi:MAG TPA: TonB-dependent receptor [Sphingomonas sp.]|nr:TonB-dependent receptor [Sphingomonas sp.]